MKDSLTNAMAWRKSVKMFDTQRKVSQVDIDDLLDTTVLSPSSFGLEPWKFIVISDDDLKTELGTAGYEQKQFTTASHIVVMCVRTEINDDYIDEMVARVSTVRGVALDSLDEYALMIKNLIASKSQKEVEQWSSLQVYLATGVLLGAAAHKRIDASPMEGFEAGKFDKILDLENTDYHALVVVALGYRCDLDSSVSWEKVRRSRNTLVIDR